MDEPSTKRLKTSGIPIDEPDQLAMMGWGLLRDTLIRGLAEGRLDVLDLIRVLRSNKTLWQRNTNDFWRMVFYAYKMTQFQRMNPNGTPQAIQNEYERYMRNFPANGLDYLKLYLADSYQEFRPHRRIRAFFKQEIDGVNATIAITFPPMGGRWSRPPATMNRLTPNLDPEKEARIDLSEPEGGFVSHDNIRLAVEAAFDYEDEYVRENNGFILVTFFHQTWFYYKLLMAGWYMGRQRRNGEIVHMRDCISQY